MGKRLAPDLAALVMFIPVVAHALGLGNMTMNSALNQPLSAEIELLSVQSGDLDNLSIRLGTSEDFERVGVIREFFYTEFKFAIAKKSDGTSYIQLTTTKPITEPFLDFVVEARWARGRILREFTVLVDPPALSEEAPAPIQQAATVSTPAPESAPQVSRQEPEPVAPPAPVQPAEMEPAMEPAMQEPVQPAPIPERAELKPVLNRGELSYGPVKYRDTLFDIANKMRPDNVTTNQMMLALVRNNPKAFYHGNINQLKAGFVLRIDDRETLTSMSEADARVEVDRQHVEWIARKSGKIVRQTSEAPASGKVSRGDKSDGKPATAAEQARLKLVAPGSEGVGSGAGDEEIGRMREDLLLAAEALDANKQETDELKTRMAEMEEQLESMQRLIMLKDDEMMAIQKQFGKEAAAEQAAETPEAALEDAASDTSPAETMAGEGVEKMPADEAKATAEKPVKKAPAPAKPKSKPAPESSLVDDVLGQLSNPMVLAGIGLIVLIAGFVVYRKRKSDGFEESILSGEDGGGGDLGATAESMEDSNESSMVSDFSMSEMSGMGGVSADAADADPVSEADVYLAYGRHQQAEEILNEALASDPNRHDVKLKLLEVFFAAKNDDAFEKGAQELHDALGDESDPLWARAVTMGQQLCPNNALFGGTPAETPDGDLSSPVSEDVADDISDASEEDLLDFDFDIDSDSDSGDKGVDDIFAELEAATADDGTADVETSDDADAALDFDTPITPDAVEAPVVDESAAEEAESSDDNSLDFDVSDLDFTLDTEESSDEPAETAEADTGLDFHMDTNESEAEDVVADTSDGLDDLADDAFGEVDEVGTKLDLAKAYVDMGDSDGARSILDEVLEEGDDAQKAQAQELLSQLG